MLPFSSGSIVKINAIPSEESRFSPLSQGFLIATFLLVAVELEELQSYYGKLSEKNNPQVS